MLTLLAMEGTLFLTTGRLNLSDTNLLLHAAVFAAAALAIDSTTEALRRERRHAERSASHLEDLNIELEQQMEHIQLLSDDLSRTNKCLAEARDAAQDASRAREEMLAVVAHDLRNPLNLVMMTTELITDTHPSAERRDQLLGVMRRSARRMNRLIEDLLEVVRQESGQMTLDVGEVSVSSMFAQTEEMFHAESAEKGVSLHVENISPALTVWADSERILQVMSNLLGNAMKFVPRGGNVIVKAQPKGAEVIFAVADTGPGMSKEDLDRLFEKFWQRRRTDKRGVGLGLSIARGIVEAHGGRIWCESTVGVGSAFYFTLPLVSHVAEAPVRSLQLAAATS
jgi:signal transduction histidine kinase